MCSSLLVIENPKGGERNYWFSGSGPKILDASPRWLADFQSSRRSMKKPYEDAGRRLPSVLKMAVLCFEQIRFAVIHHETVFLRTTGLEPVVSQLGWGFKRLKPQSPAWVSSLFGAVQGFAAGRPAQVNERGVSGVEGRYPDRG